MANEKRRRVDAAGRAYAGSQLQVQIYVTRGAERLSAAVGSAIGANPALIEWTAPRANERYSEPMDARFLDALRLPGLRQPLRTFWPRRGPRWDALAVVRGPDGDAGYILVEGKSYPDEFSGGGCAATPDAREVIERSLNQAKASLGVSADADWMRGLYQYANRLAHVVFLREHTGKPAWLVNLCFTDDPTKRATTEATWRASLAEIKKRLGFAGDIPFSVDVLLPGLPREQLLIEQPLGT